MMILEIGNQLNKQPKSGFTLVELVIVLTVLGVIAAMSIPSIDGVMDERQAREPVAELAAMAREVRNRALTEQRPYQIAFDADGFRASRYYNPYGGREGFDALQETLQNQRQLADFVAASQRQIEVPGVDNLRTANAIAGRTFTAAYKVPSTIDYSVRSWRDTDWRNMEGGAFYRWVFQPSGMCDPIKVQFSYENAFFEVEFHPLTADIKDETSWVD